MYGNSPLLELGVGGIFAIMILEKVFNFLRGKSNLSSKHCSSAKEILDVRDFTIEQKMLNKTIANTQEKLVDLGHRQTVLIEKMHDKQLEIASGIRRLHSGDRG